MKYTEEEIKKMNMSQLTQLESSDLSSYSESEKQLIKREAHKKRGLYKTDPARNAKYN
jgi:hypothetical protein